MKRIKAILILLIIIGNTLLSFSQIKRDSVLTNTDNYYFVVNNQNYILKNNNSKFQIFLKDSSITERNKNYFSISDYHYNPKSKKIYIADKSSNIWAFNIQKKSMENIFHHEDASVLYLINNKKAIYKLNKKLFLKDIEKGENKNIDVINQYIESNELTIGQLITFPTNNNILVSSGHYEQGGFFNLQYHLYNFKKQLFKKFKVNNELKSIFGENLTLINHYNLDQSYVFIDSIIIDSNFNHFGTHLDLNLSSDIRGFKFSNNKLKRLFVLSEIDKKDKFGNPGTYVLIQYTPSPYRERIMYRLYHNKILDKEELERFDAFELRLFRNMIFAKYNYDFNDKYLTAYFNMYGFYRPHKDTRTKDMSGKLTEADKKNLELIKKMENEM
jgi:hypothetical protein